MTRRAERAISSNHGLTTICYLAVIYGATTFQELSMPIQSESRDKGPFSPAFPAAAMIDQRFRLGIR